MRTKQDLLTATFTITDPNGVSFQVVGLADALHRFHDMLDRTELHGRFVATLDGEVVLVGIR